MLEYSKMILKKVSFDNELFKRELDKCITWVGQYEQKALLLWCMSEFGKEYKEVIMETFINHYI